MTTKDEIDELKAATRAAHATIKDLNTVIRDAERTIGQLRELVDTESHKAVDEILAREAKAGLDKLGEVVKTVTDEATVRIKERFALVDEQLELMLKMGDSLRDRANPPVVDASMIDAMRVSLLSPENDPAPNRETRRKRGKR